MATKNNCSICLNNFTKPKLLPCQHTFCEECIDDHINAQAHLNKFICPTCKQESDIPPGGASQLPDDDDDDDKQYCTDHQNEEVKVYCRDCRKPCCSVCVKADHKDHTMAELDEIDQELREMVMVACDNVLDEVQTPTFTSSFSLNQIVKRGEEYYGDVEVIQRLQWCVCIRDITSKLYIYLRINDVEDKTIKTVKASYTVKLLNINDESKSLVKQDTRTFRLRDNICLHCVIGVNMDKLRDVNYGLIDNNQTFNIQTTVDILAKEQI